ncbi:MAG: hypothetical protein VKN60_09495, partial [Cyanobacteriota bacterium]|nr:hypothetical protein [Cyanobacteriota bacterium]
LPEPPYFLVFVGLFMGISCGLAFEATLKQKVKTWLNTPDSTLQDLDLQLPFFGICVGVCVFLASGVEIFLGNPWFSYGLSLPITFFIAALVWRQLDSLLGQLKAGGSKAIDLDVF